jgi:hypothetical protein
MSAPQPTAAWQREGVAATFLDDLYRGVKPEKGRE